MDLERRPQLDVHDLYDVRLRQQQERLAINLLKPRQGSQSGDKVARGESPKGMINTREHRS